MKLEAPSDSASAMILRTRSLNDGMAYSQYDHLSMACNTLCRRHAGSEAEIANKGTDSNREHHPSVVGHEEQPKSCVRNGSEMGRTFCLHDEETVEDLYSIQSSFHKHALAVRRQFAVSSYNEP